ncbi:YciI family protein [Phyllobacterium sp. OV277]|jgi:uncharacterized protein YciI|uniref:YciI family protein n=1 Tax=Phyllobacterium sp. OV277 TaxID=1882772 RepID=UPI0008926A6F|nr:YciI family protein [Phyllobacterium sp. OV277]SDP46573.1 Uncharacterized conserved protein YciI, contains a putative active-site phosphohistidine [Phyllobacterium sp. OV277]
MRHFLVEGEHLIASEELFSLLPQHIEFLQKGHDDGFLLFSGPDIAARGGILVARAKTLPELEQFLSDEQFTKAKMMRSTR